MEEKILWEEGEVNMKRKIIEKIKEIMDEKLYVEYYDQDGYQVAGYEDAIKGILNILVKKSNMLDLLSVIKSKRKVK
jgi:hypothetical protein